MASQDTLDLDLLIRRAPENARRILEALSEFGFASLGLAPDDFISPGKVIQLGVAPVRIDIVTSITGVSWDEAAAGRVEGKYGDVPACFIGRKELIRNKEALGRKKDQADLEALGSEKG